MGMLKEDEVRDLRDKELERITLISDPVERKCRLSGIAMLECVLND